jgi:16S rRNA (cytidine1402-2'-O)-methyltransferase
VAYVSDAGTPGLADPGAELVRAAREAGALVVPLPGPCAPAVAFSVSGLETSGFVFAGFVPRQAGARREFLRRWLGRELPVIVFESPQRIEATLAALAELAPEREVVLCREMTKAFEQIVAGPARELPAALSPEQLRGEFTLVIAGSAEPEPPGAAGPEELAEALGLLREAGVPRKTVARVLQLLGGLSRNEAYDRAGEE